MRQTVRRLQPKLRRLIAKSWTPSHCYYPLRGARLVGRPSDEIWYFAYGANMHDSASRVRRGIQPLECRPGHIKGYQLRVNLQGRPKGRAAPANLSPDPRADVWGVLCRITRRNLMRLDSKEGRLHCSGQRGRWQAVSRYITLLRDGARAYGLPAHYIRFFGKCRPRTVGGRVQSFPDVMETSHSARRQEGVLLNGDAGSVCSGVPHSIAGSVIMEPISHRLFGRKCVRARRLCLGFRYPQPEPL